MNTCELLKSGAVLIDVRTPNEYMAGALPSAINLPLDEMQSAEKIISKEDTVILYCVSGARSFLASTQLKEMGFDNVHDLGSFRNFNC